MSLKSVLSQLSLLELALAILIEVNLLAFDEIVGGNILLLHVSQVGLNAHRVVTELAQEVVTEVTGLIGLSVFHYVNIIL